MSKTLVVIAAALAVLVAYQMPSQRGERAQTTFNEISAWVQARF
jgi:hypothetical protein